MSESVKKPASPKKPTSPDNKKPVQILRERRGGVSQELVERNRRQTAVRRKITGALEEGPKIVPELARETGHPAHEIFRRLMGMKKYGNVIEGEEREGYFEYALVEQSNPSEARS